MSSRYAERVLAHEQDHPAILAQLTGLGGRRRAIIATEDRWLEFMVAHRASIEGAYGVVLAPSNEALGICLDKAAFARWCVESALPAPRSWSLDDLGGVTLPALVRPVSTLHDRPEIGVPKAVFVESLNDLNDWAGRFRALGVDALVSESLLERRLTQYSIPFARKKGAITSFVARKVRPPASWARTGTYVELLPNAEVERLARAAVEALDYFGIGEVEILQSEEDRRCYLIEINARPWVQYTLAAASGHDLLGLVLGSHPSSGAKQPRKKGIRWISLRADLYVCFSGSEGLVARGKQSLAEYLVSLFKANAFAHFDLRDPWPAIKEFAALAGEVIHAIVRRAARIGPGLEKRP